MGCNAALSICNWAHLPLCEFAAASQPYLMCTALAEPAWRVTGVLLDCSDTPDRTPDPAKHSVLKWLMLCLSCPAMLPEQ